jgi:hypothetical protein
MQYEVYQYTAQEYAETLDDTKEIYSKVRRYKAAERDPAVYARMMAAIIEDRGITGGWYFHYTYPGSGDAVMTDPEGPYASAHEAMVACREAISEWTNAEDE